MSDGAAPVPCRPAARAYAAPCALGGRTRDIGAVRLDGRTDRHAPPAPDPSVPSRLGFGTILRRSSAPGHGRDEWLMAPSPAEASLSALPALRARGRSSGTGGLPVRVLVALAVAVVVLLLWR